MEGRWGCAPHWRDRLLTPDVLGGRREPPYHPPRGLWHHCSSFERLRAAPRANRAESALRTNFPGCASGRSRRVPRSVKASEGIFGGFEVDLREFGQRDALLPVRAGGLHSFLHGVIIRGGGPARSTPGSWKVIKFVKSRLL